MDLGFELSANLNFEARENIVFPELQSFYIPRFFLL